jgi:hypothetical protein
MNEKELKSKWMSERQIKALSIGCEISDCMNKGWVLFDKEQAGVWIFNMRMKSYDEKHALQL